MLKNVALFAAMVAGVAIAGGANAAVSFSFTPGVSSPSGVGYTVVQNFNSAAPTGLTGTNYMLHAGSPNDSNGAAPNASGTQYLAVLAGGLATYTLTNAASAIQFDWGTASDDNLLTVFTTAGNFTYSVPNSTNPGGGTNVNYGVNGLLQATASTGSLITAISFGAKTNSFEVDNIAVSGAVPEPATWAMMVLGFGLVGATVRSRKTSVAFA